MNEHRSQIVMGFRKIGLERQRLSVFRGRLFEVAARLRRHAEVVVRLGVLRSQSQCGGDFRSRPGVVAVIGIPDAKAVVGHPSIRILGKARFEQCPLALEGLRVGIAEKPEPAQQNAGDRPDGGAHVGHRLRASTAIAAAAPAAGASAAWYRKWLATYEKMNG